MNIEPPGGFRRVSPKLRYVWLISTVLWLAIPVVALVVLWLIFGGWYFWVPAALLGVTAVISAVIAARQARTYGYEEREFDLVIVHGILFRATTVVPYGRMQFVDQKSDPLQRRFGLATVELHTAAQSTKAQIPGLPKAEAERLRDALAARGESELAGL